MREIREDGGGGQINRMPLYTRMKLSNNELIQESVSLSGKKKRSHPFSSTQLLMAVWDVPASWLWQSYWKEHGCIHTYLFKVLLTVLEDTRLERGLPHQVWLRLIFLFVLLLCHFTLPPTAQWSQLQIQAINLGYLQLFGFSCCEAIQINAR